VLLEINQFSAVLYNVCFRPTQKVSPFGAYRATCGDGSWLLWPFPCRRRRPATGLRPQLYV